MQRRTKIVATIGPASEHPEVLKRLVDAGMDVARIGLAHGPIEAAQARIRTVREVSRAAGREVGILVDLPGPKVRLGTFPDGGVSLENGSTVLVRPGVDHSTATSLGVDYESLLTDVHPGDQLAIGDGGVRLRITSVDGDAAKAEVLDGGLVQGRPGLHVPSDRLTMPTPTPDDLERLDALGDDDVDMVAVSFVRTAQDLRRLGVDQHPRGPLVVAKIETRAAVENIDTIVAASGAIMVARGDLGIEMGIEELPLLQKRIIRECIALGKPVITATQMLESMTTAHSPTRAEVSDVANAVFDGSSAVMLSGETAIGIDPANAVGTMARICARADAEFDYDGWARRLRAVRRGAVGSGSARITDAMTGAAWRAASDMGAAAIICISDSGFTVRSIARFRPTMKILGFSPVSRTVRQLSLSWGTVPLNGPVGVHSLAKLDELVVIARDGGHVRSGDLVAVLMGASSGQGGGGDSLGTRRDRATDVLRLLRVP
jgi:pyruvate kinase